MEPVQKHYCIILIRISIVIHIVIITDVSYSDNQLEHSLERKIT